MTQPIQKLTISGFSTALFSTWYFIDELSLLFDCGDGVCAGLLQKFRKIKHVFLPHADRDHVTGLLQFSQLNSRPGLKICYPRDSGTFPALQEFTAKFDPHVSGAEWKAVLQTSARVFVVPSFSRNTAHLQSAAIPSQQHSRLEVDLMLQIPNAMKSISFPLNFVKNHVCQVGCINFHAVPFLVENTFLTSTSIGSLLYFD